jgi:hypothetical protein
MCMPRYFGSKLIDGKVEEKKNLKKSDKEKSNKKHINQATVEFEDEDINKRD